MDYELTRPCATCPFRCDGKGVTLRPERVDELEMQLMMAEFACHKTVDYDAADWDGEGDYNGAGLDHAQHCAGALILLENLEQPHQMMRISERLGAYDARKLDMDAPVFESWEDMRYHMEEAEEASGGSMTEEICRVCDRWLTDCECVRPVDDPPPRKAAPPPPPPRKRHE